MKMIKLMTVTALTVGAVLGTVVESAEARGGRWSIHNSGVFDIDYNFSLFTETPEGEEIFDSEPDYQYLGVFKGAIKNYNYTVIEDWPRKTNPYVQKSDLFDVLDLRVRSEWYYRYIYREPGNRTREWREYIEYSFINPKTGRNEIIPPGFGSRIFDFRMLAVNIPQELDPVNSLKDIFTLFSLKDDQTDQTGELLIERLLELDTLNPDNVEVSVSVPESDISNSLLILGVVGAGWGLQRKLNRKS
jgi:hypothetical protein